MYGSKPLKSSELPLYGSARLRSSGRKKSPPRSPMSGLLASEVRFAYDEVVGPLACGEVNHRTLPSPQGFSSRSISVSMISFRWPLSCSTVPAGL